MKTDWLVQQRFLETVRMHPMNLLEILYPLILQALKLATFLLVIIHSSTRPLRPRGTLEVLEKTSGLCLSPSAKTCFNPRTTKWATTIRTRPMETQL